MLSDDEKKSVNDASATTNIQEFSEEMLTSRELEILNLIFSGRASSEVATILCVSKRTVDFHLGKVYVKLGVKNRIQAFKRATELGLISIT